MWISSLLSVLGDKQRISLVDIRIPEQYFEFTNRESIGTDGRYGNRIKIILLSEHLGKYNARRLQQVINGDPLKAELGLEIKITDKAAYLTTQKKQILVSEELTKNFNIPRELKPFSVVKISVTRNILCTVTWWKKIILSCLTKTTPEE